MSSRPPQRTEGVVLREKGSEAYRIVMHLPTAHIVPSWRSELELLMLVLKGAPHQSIVAAGRAREGLCLLLLVEGRLIKGRLLEALLTEEAVVVGVREHRKSWRNEKGEVGDRRERRPGEEASRWERDARYSVDQAEGETGRAARGGKEELVTVCDSNEDRNVAGGGDDGGEGRWWMVVGECTGQSSGEALESGGTASGTHSYTQVPKKASLHNTKDK